MFKQKRSVFCTVLLFVFWVAFFDLRLKKSLAAYKEVPAREPAEI